MMSTPAKIAAAFSMSRAGKHLVLMVDGASRGNPGPSAIGVVVKDAQGQVVKEINEYIGKGTNNVAEYRALIRALEEAKALGARSIEVRSDSELLVSQLQGNYKVKSPDLGPLYLDVVRLLRDFDRHAVVKIPRGENAAPMRWRIARSISPSPDRHTSSPPFLRRRISSTSRASPPSA